MLPQFKFEPILAVLVVWKNFLL